MSSIFFKWYSYHRNLPVRPHAFPTRRSSDLPKERQKARRFFFTALKTHPKQNLIRDVIERSDDAAVAYVIIQNTTEHRIEMLLAFSGRRLMDQDEAWLLERYQQSITVAAAMLFGEDRKSTRLNSSH